MRVVVCGAAGVCQNTGGPAAGCSAECAPAPLPPLSPRARLSHCVLARFSLDLSRRVWGAALAPCCVNINPRELLSPLKNRGGRNRALFASPFLAPPPHRRERSSPRAPGHPPVRLSVSHAHPPFPMAHRACGVSARSAPARASAGPCRAPSAPRPLRAAPASTPAPTRHAPLRAAATGAVATEAGPATSARAVPIPNKGDAGRMPRILIAGGGIGGVGEGWRACFGRGGGTSKRAPAGRCLCAGSTVRGFWGAVGAGALCVLPTLRWTQATAALRPWGGGGAGG